MGVWLWALLGVVVAMGLVVFTGAPYVPSKRRDIRQALTELYPLGSDDVLVDIGSVLSPLNRENGYADNKPPYNKMYYRLFISFEGGSYIFSSVARPVKEYINDNIKIIIPIDSPDVKANNGGWVASRRIYSGKENNIIINLPDAGTKKYSVKFFDDKEGLVFELKKIPETYLILERVNFLHAGWFRYELYENGKFADANKFYVFKDAKPQQAPPDPKGN